MPSVEQTKKSLTTIKTMLQITQKMPMSTVLIAFPEVKTPLNLAFKYVTIIEDIFSNGKKFIEKNDNKKRIEDLAKFLNITEDELKKIILNSPQSLPDLLKKSMINKIKPHISKLPKNIQDKIIGETPTVVVDGKRNKRSKKKSKKRSKKRSTKKSTKKSRKSKSRRNSRRKSN